MEPESEVVLSTVEDFWKTCAEGDVLKPLPFTVGEPHKSYLGRVDGAGVKKQGAGRLEWTCTHNECSKQWIEIVLVLVGEALTENLLTSTGNRVLGLEWEVIRTCKLTLWFDRPLPQDSKATIAVLDRHFDRNSVDLTKAYAYNVDKPGA
eukprot:m.316848 g.316848  ORF g.316848 m.316848 type:complete len:150 (+) comp27550_c2_seq3:1300-1749(+)